MINGDENTTKLDKFMIPVNAPLTSGSQLDAGYNFRSLNGRGAVGAYNLGNFNFNSGTGGTIVLGGTAQGAGNLIVRNTSGGTIATIDSNGITVLNGSITIKNNGGTTILDPTGLVSTSNFNLQSFADSNLYSVNPGTAWNQAGTNLISFVLTRSTRVLFSYNALGGYFGSVNTGLMQINVSVDGTVDLNSLSQVQGIKDGTTSNVAFVSASNQILMSLGSGTHTAFVVFRQPTTANGGSAIIDRPCLFGLVLGN